LLVFILIAIPKDYMNTYDNYYIRLSPDNFKKYLEEC
jgi:hypothetical protein